MGSNAQRDLRGSFSGYVFDNGRVKIEIDKDYARILNSKSNAVLVERFYPLVEINESGKWRAINFGERIINENEHNGWHSVAIGMVYEGKNISVHGFLQYYQKDKFRRYAPLYPSMQLWFSKRTEYRVIWKYEGIKIRHFEVIDNGTGWTRPPYQHGHGRIILYNGTVNRDIRFEDGQDIVIGYENGRKAFGLNWEKSKKNLPVLSMMNNGDDLSMSIESTSQVSTLAEPSYPIPDSGGGGGSDDSDGDGLSDSLEESGWYIWLCTSGTTWHHIKVFSDPHYRDTDNDGVDDGVEYAHGTNPEDTDTDNDGLTDEQEIDYYGTYVYTWDSDEDRMSDYYEVNYGTPNGGWQDPMVYNERYAVIIVGGGYMDPYEVDYNTYLHAFWNDGLEMYNKLVNDYKYKESNVYLLSSLWYSKYDGSWGWRGQNPSTDSRVDGEAMWNSPTHYDIKDALDDIGNKIRVRDSLMIVIIAHGGSGSFLIRNDISNSEAQQHPDHQGRDVDYSDLGTYLNDKFGTGSNRKYAIMIVVNQACYSGTMMSYLSGENRILISSAKSNE